MLSLSTFFFAAWVFGCAFFLRTQKVLAYRAHDEGAGGPSGSGHAEPRSFESGDPRAAPDARRAGGRTSLERRTAGFAPSRDRALEAVDREAATDADRKSVV